MSLLIDQLFSSVALGHLIVDILNGQRAVLLTYWSGPFGLTNASIGLYSTVFVVTAALSQPIFGYFSDRIGPRWLVSGGVFWMGFWFLLALITPSETALIYLVLGSIGSGAFHPAGAAEAGMLGRNLMGGKETTATSLFFLFGQGGGFIGPLVAGPLLDRFGLPGLIPIAFLSLPISAWAWWHLRKVGPFNMDAKIDHADGAPKTKWLSRGVIALILTATFLSWVQQNMVTFLPKYLSDLGHSPSTYGILSALFMGGYAIGNVFGGVLADKYGKEIIVIFAMSLGAIPLLIIPIIGYNAIYYLLVPLSGFLTGSAFCVILVLAQKLIRGGTGLVTGLVLGFMFSSGALGTLVTGVVADAFGFIPVFYATAGLCVAGAISAILLNKSKQ
jgi:FSR family fosmidomycin resistance protein-like MFS transporter